MVKKGLILLAEDEESDALIMQRAMKKAGLHYPLQRVSNGEEAIHYLAGEGKYSDRHLHPFPSLLLCDLKMPRTNGFEVIEWVRARPKLRRLPIIVLTASREHSDVNKAFDLGANSYVVKPTKIDHLVEVSKSLQQYWLEINEKPVIYS